jgi:hypothetical protein
MSRHVSFSWTARVIDALSSSNNAVSGHVRLSHRQGWVSALHVLTEIVVGEVIDTVQNGSPYHGQYHSVTQSVLELEEAGIIAVSRAHGSSSYVGNHVERIEVIV